MSAFMTVEAESLLDTLLSFLRGEFLWEFNHIDVHSIRVFSGSMGCRERLESLGRPSTLLGNLFCMIPLVLEVDGFHVPVINFV